MRWLAVDITRRCGHGLRVNAVAPGFFIAEQNRALLDDSPGAILRRGGGLLELMFERQRAERTLVIVLRYSPASDQSRNVRLNVRPVKELCP
jgi:NAD(P)-dependent dehydrogenase (short-subunit alcohol dehydrogenase family)